MSESQLIVLSKLVIFAVVVVSVGFILVVIGLVLPPVVEEIPFTTGGYTVYLPNGRMNPNPLQLPFMVAGAVVLIVGLALLGLQIFRRQSVKTP